MVTSFLVFQAGERAMKCLKLALPRHVLFPRHCRPCHFFHFVSRIWGCKDCSCSMKTCVHIITTSRSHIHLHTHPQFVSYSDFPFNYIVTRLNQHPRLAPISTRRTATPPSNNFHADPTIPNRSQPNKKQVRQFATSRCHRILNDGHLNFIQKGFKECMRNIGTDDT
jgi:hypothetical protein